MNRKIIIIKYNNGSYCIRLRKFAIPRNLFIGEQDLVLDNNGFHYSVKYTNLHGLVFSRKPSILDEYDTLIMESDPTKFYWMFEEASIPRSYTIIMKFDNDIDLLGTTNGILVTDKKEIREIKERNNPMLEKYFILKENYSFIEYE